MSTESPTIETATDMAALYRDALEAIREALDIPYAATTGHEEARQKILNQRMTPTLVTLERILAADPADTVIGIAWHTAYLREKLAEFPATGYVTGEEARAALAHGASWSEAVAELREQEICGPGCCSPVLGVHTSCPGPLVGRTAVSVR